MHPDDPATTEFLTHSGNMAVGLLGVGPVMDPQRYVLTAVDGTAYELDVDRGLTKVTDPVRQHARDHRRWDLQQPGR